MILPFLSDCGILQFTPSSGPNKMILLLYKLLPKVLPPSELLCTVLCTTVVHNDMHTHVSRSYIVAC